MDCNASGCIFLYRLIKLLWAFFISSKTLKSCSCDTFRKLSMPKNLYTVSSNVYISPEVRCRNYSWRGYCNWEDVGQWPYLTFLYNEIVIYKNRLLALHCFLFIWDFLVKCVTEVCRANFLLIFSADLVYCQKFLFSLLFWLLYQKCNSACSCSWKGTCVSLD